MATNQEIALSVEVIDLTYKQMLKLGFYFGLGFLPWVVVYSFITAFFHAFIILSWF